MSELNNQNGIIFNIQKFCIHDGDGIRTCVFLKGCVLRCIWCHNPEGLNIKPDLSFNSRKCTLCGNCLSVCTARSMNNGMLEFERSNCIKCGKCTHVCLNDANEIIGKEMTASQVIDEVLKDKLFYDTSGGGITVTGGEPSYQPEFCLELLLLSKKAGISVAVETCGTGSREFYEKCAELGTTFLFDIKCIDSALHKKLTGADNAKILSNLYYLMDSGADIIIRLPLIPGCNDSDEDIIRLASFLNENKGRYRYAEIMPYHMLGKGKAEKLGVNSIYIHESANEAETARWCALFATCGTDVKVSK